MHLALQSETEGSHTSPPPYTEQGNGYIPYTAGPEAAPGGRQFFASGKVLPIERGAGLTQPAMALAARLAAGGEWLHLFPEARALCA
jgi:hypothetical protein